MEKCPHNESVECNAQYRDREIQRQFAIVLRSGMFWFGNSNKCCNARPWMCQRLKQHQR